MKTVWRKLHALDTAKGCSLQQCLETSSELSILVQFETRSRERIAVLRSHSIVLHDTLPAVCIEKVVCMKTKDVVYQKVRLPRRVHRVVLTSNSRIGPEDQREQDALTSCDQPGGSKMPWATGSNTVDYRILGVPLSAIEQQDTHRKDKVNFLIEKFEIHPNKESFLQDFNQTKEINEFSKKSHDLIADMNNTEIFELCETSSKQQHAVDPRTGSRFLEESR